MSHLAGWLLEQIALDETAALQLYTDPHWGGCRLVESDGDCDCGLPDQMLADCKSRRQLVGLHSADDDWGLKLLAAPYSDREGYREEWRP